MERYRRSIGNLTLAVFDTLRIDTPEPYLVTAIERTNRRAVTLGAFRRLDHATAYVDQYRRSFALVSPG